MKGARRLSWLSAGFAVFALLALVVCALYLPRLSFDNNILALFPGGDKAPAVSRAEQLLASRISQKVFFLVAADDRDALRQRLPQVADRLADCDCFAAVHLRMDAEPWLALQAYYQDFAPRLLHPSQRQALQQVDAALLEKQVLRDLLTTPGVSIGSRLQQDPFATLAGYMDELRPAIPGMQLDDQGYVSLLLDGRRYVFFHAVLADSPYSIALQQQAGAALTAARQPLADLPGLDWQQTGVLFYTMAGTQQAVSEISTVGLGSLLGILLLFGWVFRSPGLLLLSFFPIAAGVLVALAVCQWLFGQVHVISLVFGASLVGIAIDYALHFFTRRHAMGPNWHPAVCMAHLLPALTLGLVSSVLAWLGFILSGFPGFTQVAIFSAVGLVTAYGVVVGLYPWLLRHPAGRPLPGSLTRLIAAWRDTVQPWVPRLLRWPVLLPGLALLAVGLWRIEPQDDVRAMQIPDAGLRAAEERFQLASGQQTALQYLLVEGADLEALLQNMEYLQQALDRLITAGALDNYRMLARWLPSQQQQERNLALWQARLLDSGALPGLLQRLGVVPELAASLQKHYQATGEPLDPEVLLPLLQQLPDAPLFFQQEDHWYGVITLEQLRDPAALARLAGHHPGVLWVDIVGQTNALLKQYRTGTLGLLGAACLVIALLFSLRYGLRGALAILLPPLLAGLITLSLSGWFGWPVSVFNMMALLLVLGIGIDAALFMRESGGRENYVLLAIALSTLTTLLSFGLLSLSATAAIHSFGITILFGITFCFILAPLATLSGWQTPAPAANGPGG